MLKIQLKIDVLVKVGYFKQYVKSRYSGKGKCPCGFKD